MPKRTNDFQKLIKSIYEQIVPDGGKVTESGMVYDKDAETLREVDILVKYRYAHHDFKIAIECRNRSRKDSVEWIDRLIGKSKSLSVNKVVAVSKEGFSEIAIKKAEAHNIDTLTLKNAVETDWGKYPIKPGLIILSGENYRLRDVLFKDGVKYRSLKEIDLRSSVIVNGVEIGSIKDTFEYFFVNHLSPFIQKYKKQEIIELFKTRADLGKTLCIESSHNFPGCFAHLSTGEEVDISNLKFIISGTRRTAEVEQKHYKFNELMVSMGQYLDTDGSAIKCNIVQDLESNTIHTRLKREKVKIA
jgi:hypothetical protein